MIHHRRPVARGVVSDVFAALGELSRAIGNLVSALTCCGHGGSPTSSLHLVEALVMYIVKADQPDVPYQLSFKVADSEGNPISDPQGLTVEFVSDNPAAVTLTPDPTDQRKGTAHFESPNADGTPSVAGLVATVKLEDGTVVGSFGAQVTVTVGDPAAIQGGTLVLEGLTEAPPPSEGGPESVPGTSAREKRSVSK